MLSFMFHFPCPVAPDQFHWTATTAIPKHENKEKIRTRTFQFNWRLFVVFNAGRESKKNKVKSGEKRKTQMLKLQFNSRRGPPISSRLTEKATHKQPAVESSRNAHGQLCWIWIKSYKLLLGISGIGFEWRGIKSRYNYTVLTLTLSRWLSLLGK